MHPDDIDSMATGHNSRNRFLLIVAIGFPTLLTWVYFVLLADCPAGVQQAVYVTGKTIQFALPVIWAVLIVREPPRWCRPSVRGLSVGFAFGLIVLSLMVGLYFAWLKPGHYLQGLEQEAVQKIRDMALDTVWKYAAVGLFYALVHSLLEEYYWRWFVFGQLRKSCSLGTAVTVSSLGFMAHHVILLTTFFGWASPLAYLFSLAVAIGGAAWALLYESSRSLWGPWLSHMLVDAGIFVIGYDLVRAQLG